MVLNISKFIVLLLVLSAQMLIAQAPPYVLVENTLRVYPLDAHARVLVDSSAALKFEDVSRPETLEKFRPLESGVATGQPGWAYWLHFRMAAKDTLKDWMILLKNPAYQNVTNRSTYTAGNEYVDGYFRSSTYGEVHRRDGFYLPKSQRSGYRHPMMNALSVSLAAGDTADVFLRVQNLKKGYAALASELRPSSLEIPFGKSDMQTLMGLCMGVTGILAILCLFFFFVDRDVANLHFFLFCLFLFLHYSILHPEILFIEWFASEKPWLLPYAFDTLAYFSFFFFLLFGRSFVNVRQHSPLTDRLMLAMAGGLVLLWLAGLLDFHFGGSTEILNWSPVVIAILLLLLAIRIGFFKSNFAKIFAAGAGWLFFFTLLGPLYNNGIFTLFNPWPVGQLGMMVIYTFGLAYKLQLHERAKADAKRVLELDGIKSRFFANISHEFRTPLTLILAPLKKAQEQAPASESEHFFENGEAEISLPARHLGMMRRNAERLGQLIDQLLDLSKLESGNMKLQVAKGDIVSFLRAMVFSFESLAERRQIHFQTEFPERGEEAYFDRDKLEKILVNLLSNAFKYTPERGRVSVKTAIENGRLKVSVEDSGPGISQKDLDKVFERFYQIEGTEDKGTGIGLSLVKELVELHRGQISVDSTPGRGTAFKISLPVAREFFAEAEIATEAVPDSTTSRPNPAMLFEPAHPERFSSENGAAAADLPLLLVVEDNPDLRSYISEAVASAYRVISADNGRRGLELALEYTPDLLVSDVMMPEMDGFQLCEKLKTDERTSHIPVILLTAKAGQQHKLEGLETGADAYLTKPFDEAELLLRARKLIEQRRKLREHFAAQPALKPTSVALPSTDQRFLDKVAAAIEENMGNEFFSVEDLAAAVHFSRSQLHRKLKSLIGKSPTDLIREFRLCRAKELLEQKSGNVSEIALEVGYSSLSYFTRSFKAAFGVLPSEV
ncbi:MAG: hypothetical protein CMN32_04955 [Saprospirales bacterium]|nr:hypothetical protein [Saprospirales bacterium]